MSHTLGSDTLCQNVVGVQLAKKEVEWLLDKQIIMSPYFFFFFFLFGQGILSFSSVSSTIFFSFGIRAAEANTLLTALTLMLSMSLELH